MNKRISLGAAIAFIFVVAAATISMTMIYSQRSFNNQVNNLGQRQATYSKFSEIDRVVRDSFHGTINENQLMDHIAEGYIRGIGDRYARYIPAQEYARMNTQAADGEHVGIGAVVEAGPDGYLVIIEIYPDSPALTAGILPGDLIVRLDETDLNIDNVQSQLSEIYGLPGTKLTLTIRRGGEEYYMDLTRRAVPVPTVYSRMLGETQIAYIQIREFGANTSDQFNRELDRMITAGARGIIFDLRDNRGGVMRQATRILDRLIPAGVIYTAQRRDGTVEFERSDSNALDLPMAVIVNSGTASAAELFAAVLRDYDKARLVGTGTAGKGVMQDIIPLSDGSAVEITVAYYNPPISPNFDGTGLVPDFEVGADDSVAIFDDADDMQLQKAIEAVTTAMTAIRNQEDIDVGEDDLE